jgi:trimeric autotransporter adhesin
MALSGDERAVMSDGAVLLSARGVSLAYGGLIATDARGRRLPAHIQLLGDRLSLVIDDRGARYPLRVDPFVQQAKLTASDGARMGLTVAVSGDMVVASDDGATVNGQSQQGAAYVFVKPSGGWASAQETARLTASDGAAGQFFGESVAIEGDTIVVGNEDADNFSGAAYVFVKPAGGWVSGTETAKLTASHPAFGNLIGASVAIDGDTVVAGADGFGGGGFGGQGAAFVFVKPAGGWASEADEAVLTAASAGAFDGLGAAVAVSGDTVVAGSLNANTAFVFVEPPGGWADENETARLTASQAGNLGFGQAVAISGDTIVAGAEGAQEGAIEPGAAYVFVKPADGWVSGTETAELTASDGAGADELGNSVAIDGDKVLVGAWLASIGGIESPGAAYVFAKPAGGWASQHEAAKLTASDGTEDSELGNSVAIDGDTVVAGAPGAQVGANSFQGALYVFGPGPSSTAVGCSPTPVVGQSTNCTATVTDTAAGPSTPTGTVSFDTGGAGRLGSGGSCALTGGGAAASCAVSFTATAAGTKTIRASYGGDLQHVGSTGSVSQLVDRAQTTTTVTGSANPAPSGQAVTFTASVGVVAPGAGTPTGTVTFFDGTTRIGASSLAGGRATFTSSALASGEHTITAGYSGDQNFKASSGSLTGNPRDRRRAR